MKIVLGVLLITVASALNHYDINSWKRREDFKVATASRSIAPIKVKEARSQRLNAHSAYKARSSNLLRDNIHQNSLRKFTIMEDSDEHQDIWNSDVAKERQDLTRENRAIETTLKNVIGQPSLGKVEYFSNFPYESDESAILENAEDPKDTAFSKDTENYFLDNNAKEVDWSGQDVFEKDLQDEEEEEINIEEFLDEIRQKRLNGEVELTGTHRQGRRRKLTSQQQGVLLVETLRKKRNHTNDHRGHSSNLQSGLMDMLGRSMFLDFLENEMEVPLLKKMLLYTILIGYLESEKKNHYSLHLNAKKCKDIK